ncbi:MAG: 50S ribosome-binding GTPase [Planctomycetia bacterium]|nr:50S ribosome-binding GTPase [Planctomycetia bacterium]
MIRLDETIAARASAAGPAARGIVRISGLGSQRAVESLFSPKPLAKSAPQRYGGALEIAGLGRPLAADLYLWPNSRSFTGQPLAELHTVGSQPVLDAVLSALFAHGVRPAAPGEFTLRAFLAGRIDLTQAEAVLGIIDARGERELQTALDQMAGGLSSQILRLRGDLIDLLADLEAGLDFADEAIEFVSHASLVGRLGLALDRVVDLLLRAETRMRPPSRPRVVLAGPPNTGKSTLFNALAGMHRALVSADAGTTRDYLATEIAVGGVTVELFDTAGRAPAVDGIECQAQQLGQEQIEQAALVVWCRAADHETDVRPNSVKPECVLPIVTKGDLAARESLGDDLVVSAQTGAGLSDLAAAIASRLSHDAASDSPLLDMTAARSLDSLNRARDALNRAVAIAREEVDQELLAIEVRETLDELGKIAGAVYTDDILDRIFSKFCIGK